MSMTLFTFPIKPGKLETYLSFMNECMKGNKQKEYKDLLLRYKLNSTTMWHHNLNGKDYAMFIHDMDDDGMEKLKSWDQSTHPFDKLFDQKLRECYDTDNEDQPIFVGTFNAKD